MLMMIPMTIHHFKIMRYIKSMESFFKLSKIIIMVWKTLLRVNLIVIVPQLQGRLSKAKLPVIMAIKKLRELHGIKKSMIQKVLRMTKIKVLHPKF